MLESFKIICCRRSPSLASFDLHPNGVERERRGSSYGRLKRIDVLRDSAS